MKTATNRVGNYNEMDLLDAAILDGYTPPKEPNFWDEFPDPYPSPAYDQSRYRRRARYRWALLGLSIICGFAAQVVWQWIP